MSLVSGYDSDGSDGGAITSAAPAVKRTGLAAMLPPPTSSGRGQGTLPPVASSSRLPNQHPHDTRAEASSAPKRKTDRRQIRIGKLSDEEADEEPDMKRAKPMLASTTPSGSRHGLLGMLPAPTQKVVPAKTKDAAASELATRSGADRYGMNDEAGDGRAMSIDEGAASKTSKGNNDFRAMLGLKPVPQKTRPTATARDAVGQARPNEPRSDALGQDALSSSARLPTLETLAQPSQQHVNFFGLEASSNSSRGQSGPTTASSVSLAPPVHDEEDTAPDEEEHEDPYEGWQQGPDGAWFPVTPAAHARYAAHLASQAEARAQLETQARLRGIDPALVKDIDANSNLDDWLATRQGDASTTADKKYLAAAASVATPEQARALGLDKRDENDEEALAEEERKRRDRSTNFRARRRGQLSSLVAQAEENKEKLEEKWARGKANRDEARSRYGW